MSSALFSESLKNLSALRVSPLVIMLLAFSIGCAQPAEEVADAQGEAQSDAVQDTWTCSTQTDLPGDIVPTVADASQTDLDQYSWDSFLALNASSVEGTIPTSGDTTPLWSQWSSTVDFIENQGGDFGVANYPTTCQNATLPEGKTYSDYRVIAQVDKVNDSIVEAGDVTNTSIEKNRTQGVGFSDPLIAANGHFVRYEIVINEVLFNYVKDLNLYNQAGLAALTGDLSFPAATNDDNGGDPSNANSGAIAVKLAWLNSDGLDTSQFHTADLLVFTPGDYNSTGQDSCELQTMALVGMHLVRKTTKQPNWIWGTFEHKSNTPQCSGLPPQGTGSPSTGSPNTACPDSYSASYTLNPGTDCDGGDCASCNTAPEPNCSGTSSSGWCVDQKATSGFSQLCRQVQTGGQTTVDGYGSAGVNSTCASSLGSSVWANYELISTQWINSSGDKVPTLPVGPIDGSTGEPKQRAYLANVTMESTERSNCLGCHNAGVISADDNPSQPSTDSMFWIAIEVPEGPSSDTASLDTPEDEAAGP